MCTFDVVVFDQYGNFTRTSEDSDFNDSEFAEIKSEGSYSYKWIIGYILLLTKYHIKVNISDILTSNEKKSNLWNYEKEKFGEYWIT